MTHTKGRNAGNPELCASCAATGEACCRLARIFLTTGDMRRIAAAVGDRAFAERIAVSRAFRERGLAFDPAWDRIFQGGDCRVLRRRAGGGCLFLSPSGCELPVEARPLVCRLYPFDYDAAAIKGVHGHLCPEGVRDNGPLLLALLGMDRNVAEGWRKQLYEEIAEERSEGHEGEGQSHRGAECRRIRPESSD